MAIEIRHLRAFVTLAEELHFRRAAERLHITQPPLTAAIQALEEELGARLFDRTKRRVELTHAGSLLLARARSAVILVDHFREFGRLTAKGFAGTVRLGTSPSTPFIQPLTRALSEFQKTYPEVSFEMPFTVSATRAVEALTANTLDACTMRLDLTSSARLGPHLRHFVVQKDQIMLALPSDHPLARSTRVPLSLVEKEQFLLHRHEAGDGGQPISSHHLIIIELFRRAGLQVPNFREVPELTSVLGLVASRLGISILPGSLQVLRPPGVVWREIELSGSLLESEVVMAYRADSEESNPALARFLAMVRTYVTQASGLATAE